MDTVYAILILAAFVGAYMLWKKATKAASRALATKVFQKAEFEEGKHLLAGLTVETTAQVADVMRELRAHVQAADTPNAVVGSLYVAAQTDSRIDYTLGTKFGDSFKAAVAVTVKDGVTVGHFRVHRWHESDGIIVAQKTLRQLRKEVKEAFKAADPNARIIEGLLDEIPHDGSIAAVEVPTPAESAAADSGAAE